MSAAFSELYKGVTLTRVNAEQAGATWFQSSDLVMMQWNLRTSIQICLCQRRAWINGTLSEPQPPPLSNEDELYAPDRLLSKFSEAPGVTAGCQWPWERLQGPWDFPLLSQEAPLTMNGLGPPWQERSEPKHMFALNFTRQTNFFSLLFTFH